MKKTTTTIFGITCFILLTTINYRLNAQLAFHRGSLSVSISEGHTLANFATKNISDAEHPSLVKRGAMIGERDPLFIEYGIARQWSIGISTGTDIFHVDPEKYYGFKALVKDECNRNLLKIETNEANFEWGYHFFVTKKLDLSAFSSAGIFSVSFKGGDDETKLNYKADGTIFRFGTRARYYFWRRLGAFGMVSVYKGKSSPKDVKDNTVANNIATNISGFAVETGLCFKILK